MIELRKKKSALGVAAKEVDYGYPDWSNKLPRSAAQ
jgi:hypothetical protein